MNELIKDTVWFSLPVHIPLVICWSFSTRTGFICNKFIVAVAFWSLLSMLCFNSGSSLSESSFSHLLMGGTTCSTLNSCWLFSSWTLSTLETFSAFFFFLGLSRTFLKVSSTGSSGLNLLSCSVVLSTWSEESAVIFFITFF